MKLFFIFFMSFVTGMICFLMVAIPMHQDTIKYPPNPDLYTYYQFMHREKHISVREHYVPFILSLVLVPIGLAGMIFKKCQDTNSL